jgi:predicted HicB family RNase H-like nuclease
MPTQPKPKKVGRPKLPKGEAKGKIVALRFSAEDVKRVTAAAKAQKLSVSQWIRSTLEASLNG